MTTQQIPQWRQDKDKLYGRLILLCHYVQVFGDIHDGYLLKECDEIVTENKRIEDIINS